MSRFRLAPTFGWPVTIAATVIILGVTIFLAVRAHNQRPNVDSTATDWVRRSSISVIICLMLLGPGIAVDSTTRAVSTTDIVVALDITGSMAVQDAQYPGSDGAQTRITAARHVVNNLIDMYPDSNFAAVSFGNVATLDLPLTPDTYAMKSWIDTVVTEPTGVSQGTNQSQVIDALTTLLKDTRDQHKEDKIILYYISDGEQTSDETRSTFSVLRDYLDDAVTVGVGSDNGGKVPALKQGLVAGETLPSDQTWVQDPDTGTDGVSKRDSTTLTTIADEMSGVYQSIDASNDVGYPKSGDDTGSYRMETIEKPTQVVNQIIWPLAILLAVLLLWEVLAHAKTSRRLL